jgi:hypothetical protein
MDHQIVAKEASNPQIVSQFDSKLKQDFNLDVDLLNRACKVLPQNYNYEIHKTILKILQAKKGIAYKVSL